MRGSTHRLVALVLVLGSSAGARALEVSTLDPPLDLAGTWRCLASAPTAASPPPDDDARWHDVVLPQVDGSPACDVPSAWLQRDVAVAPGLRAATLGVSLGEVRGAYQVFADGERIGGSGVIPQEGEGFVIDSLRRGQAFAIPRAALADGMVRIEARVVRDEAALTTSQDRRVVIAGPLALGGMPGVGDRAEAAVALRVRDEGAASLAMTALFLFIGLYHVLLWLLRRDLVGYLWFGVFALVADAWITLVALAGTHWVPLDARTVAVVGNLLGSLVNACFIEFAWRFLTKARPTPAWRAYTYLLVAIGFVGFIPVVGIGWTVSPPVLVAKLAMPLLSLFVFLRAARKGSREARVLLVGLGFAALGAPVQYFVQSRGMQLIVSPAQIALSIFFLAMAVALALQFARTLDDVDARARELADTNLAIQRFVPFPFLNALDKKSVREVKRGDAIQTTMSVMFCDMRGFTTLAEHMGHEETFRFINSYLGRMEPEILKTGGFINQYLGDGIMALFPKGADAAVAAAVGMCRALETLNGERLTRGESALRIGIGIHTGTLMMGTIGGADQLDSGVVGDVVNTAARLEGITKMYGANVLLSGETMEALSTPELFALRPLDAVKAKGKKEPLVLLEVLDGDSKLVRDEKLAGSHEFAVGLAEYRAGQFHDAAARFAALAARCPNDGAAGALHERCVEFMAAPPVAWAGVLSLTMK